VAVLKCPNGHYYDDVKHAACPHCEDGGGGSARAGTDRGDSVTVAFNGGPAPVARITNDDVNAKLSRLTADERTISYFQQAIQMDPVVGWLVCLAGPERGRDYRLHAGQNHLGRGYGMDVVISDDPKVVRERHCSFVYEPVKNLFFVVPGEGTNSYLNKSLLAASAELRDGDLIDVGDTTLVFVSFCKEGFTWQ